MLRYRAGCWRALVFVGFRFTLACHAAVSTQTLAGEATDVSEGSCKTSSEGQRLWGLICGAKVDGAGPRTTATVTFNVAPDQFLHSEDRPGFGSSGKTGQSSQEVKPETFPDGSKLETLPNGTKVVTLPNGNKLEHLPDGTTWVVLHPNNELLAVRVDQKVMPTASHFATVLIVNLPESDIVNAPFSERIQVEGECSSMTYSILGVLPYAGKNGGGLPRADSALGPENVMRRVMRDTLMSHVFDLVCKKP